MAKIWVLASGVGLLSRGGGNKEKYQNYVLVHSETKNINQGYC